jgi:hypothetical protein
MTGITALLDGMPADEDVVDAEEVFQMMSEAGRDDCYPF